MKTRRTICLYSLGCPKNLVDSENLVSTLISRGFQVLRDPDEADMVLVNTCGFLDASRKESLDVIREAVKLKERGVRAVLVAGCMVGAFSDLLSREVPGVDHFVGFEDYGRIDRIADEILPPLEAADFTLERKRMDAALTPAHYAYLKISEGCNHTCAFCIIPTIRGPMRSLPMEDLVARAREMAARGVKELCLIAQDSTIYGADIYGSVRLPELLSRLDRVEGLEWIRLLYAYPTEVRSDLAEILAGGRRVLPYLDVPVQHSSDRVLRAMRRGYGRRELDRMIETLRAADPQMALRTTVIVGFPGETEEDFENLLDFVRQVRFDRLGAFKYSREPGSRAAELPGHLPEEVKEERYHALMTLQRDIAYADNRARVGLREQVLVDHPAEEGRPARARTRRDAPEIDPCVLLRDPGARPGEVIEVEILAAEGYDLEAAPLRAADGS